MFLSNPHLVYSAFFPSLVAIYQLLLDQNHCCEVLTHHKHQQEDPDFADQLL
jgi:hypothetical protein